ncbi:RICIN domain-containing protein [Caulobacter sp. S45]|uniref:RICIN domain-containing protein n=1 Tax=Caulobacter sp. S45 TaxID=1641861 RepID=UPI00131CBC3C
MCCVFATLPQQARGRCKTGEPLPIAHVARSRAALAEHLDLPCAGSARSNRRRCGDDGGLCLDVRGRSSRADGTPVQLWQCHFGANQRFALSPDGRIHEVSSGKCLIASAPKDGAPVVSRYLHQHAR